MSDMLQTGAAWLEQQRAAHMASPVVISDGSITATINATIGRTVFESADSNGTIIQTVSRDFLVLVADLVAAGLGDQVIAGTWTVTDSTSGAARVYEAMPVGGEEAARDSDQFGITLRIHTKRVQ